MMEEKKKHLNPYLAGVCLGAVLLISILISGRGLGASGGVKNAVVKTVEVVAPQHTEGHVFYSKYTGGEKKPLKAWLFFEIIGVIIGGFLSGLISGRLGFKTEKGNRIKNWHRWIFAVIGGLLFGFGAMLARGCTSGAALTGMAVLSTHGFVTMMGIFGTGFAIAWIFKRIWI